MNSRLLSYLLAAIIGLVAVFLILPIPTIVGSGPGWNPPGSDQAQTLTGHLALQGDVWRWPLLEAHNLFWPHGISIALTDSNPLISLLAKLWTKATGGAPVNMLGLFLAACWLLQPVAATYAARGLNLGTLPAFAASVLSVAWPALMIRMGHINLCGHFLILFTLGIAFRRIARAGGWGLPGALLAVAVLTQPYLFQIAAIVLASIPLHAMITGRAGWRRDCLWYVLTGVFAVGVLIVLSGPLGGADKGFVFSSMNVLGPIWPQKSGVFGADLPIIDATGGQYEGFNWLGTGTMLLLIVALTHAVRSRHVPRQWLGLTIVLGGMTLISLSSHVYMGHIMVLNLGTKPWEDIFGTFRAPGRAFWPVGYAIMLACVASAWHRPRPIAIGLLASAMVLQVIDVGPLWASARGTWETGQDIVAPAVPGGTTLFTVAPFPGCSSDMAVRTQGPIMLLDAMRRGARLGEIGLGRSPSWFNCERVLTDALELPLVPGEARAFFGANLLSGLRTAMLGPDAICRRVGDHVLCGRDVASFEGVAMSMGSPLPAPRLPLVLTGQGLEQVLGRYWHLVEPGEQPGDAWSEGPRSTLVLAVAPNAKLVLTLHVVGISIRPGGTRPLSVTIGQGDPRSFSLQDGETQHLVLDVLASAVADGVLRVALDVDHPVDPAKRGMAAPVHRAAIRLTGFDLWAE